MGKKTILCIFCYNVDAIYSYRLALHELLHSVDIDRALISETKLPKWFEWWNPGYRTYSTSGPNATYDGTAVLVKADIQHAYAKVPMSNSLENAAIMVGLKALETIIGAFYRSSVKPFEEEDFDKLIGLSKSRIFISGSDLNIANTQIGTPG